MADRNARRAVPLRSMARSIHVQALIALGLVWLVGCHGSTPMTRSAAAVEARPLFLDEAEEAPVVAPTYSSGGEASAGGAAGAAAEDARPSEAVDELREEEDRGVQPAPSPDASADSESVLTVSESTAGSSLGGGGSVYVPPPNLGWSVPIEPLPWVPLDPAPLPAGPRRVLVATMEVPPGRTIFPPVSACQDVLVYVRAGALEATGTGIGTTDAPATLYPGDAARFGPEGDGRLINRSGEAADALVIIARDPAGGAPLYTAPVDTGVCEAAVVSDLLARPLRLASAATTAPLHVLDGHLDVRILLDVDGTAAAHAGLALLEGDASMRVAPHVHDEADEILYVESGSGSFRVGDVSVEVRAGSVLYVPRGAEHAFEPRGDVPFRAVQLYAPSGPEQRFRGLAAAAP